MKFAGPIRLAAAAVAVLAFAFGVGLCVPGWDTQTKALAEKQHNQIGWNIVRAHEHDAAILESIHRIETDIEWIKRELQKGR